MIKRVIVVLFAFATVIAQASEAISLGMREQIQSKILGETRAYSVYLPPSYYTSPATRFPVLYMIDGDYHFLYVAGLLEQLSSPAAQIPEIILVAIGEKGKTAYRREVEPDLGPHGGNAAQFQRFIQQELIPHIDGHYHTNPYRALAGASLGGLFATSVLLDSPQLFNSYFLISPSIWWEDYALLQKAEKILTGQPDLKARVYLSQGNEHAMGDLDFAGLLDRKAPKSLQWKFTRFDQENHGSVMLPALQWSLRQEFAGFELTSERFRSFNGAAQLLDFYRSLKERWGFEPLLPVSMLENAVLAWQADGKPDEIRALETGISGQLPMSSANLQQAQANIAIGDGKWPEAMMHCQALRNLQTFDGNWCEALVLQGLVQRNNALQAIHAALKAVPEMSLRQWKLNQLQADARDIEAMK